MNSARLGHAWLFGLLVMALTACAVAPGDGVEPLARSSTEGVYSRDRILVIAHRGASGLRPEHTLEAYRLAIRQGADFIEPDLVMTKDGVLIARHDPWLSDSTNVADLPQFADRKRTLTSPEGVEITDWWAHDFTLAEIRQLKARQTRDGRTKAFDDRYDIPTFEDIIALVEKETEVEGRQIGLYPEAKWPIEHAIEGLDMQGAIIAALDAHGLNSADSAVFIQSFEPRFLINMDKVSDVKLVQLVFANEDGAQNASLDEVAGYADAVGPYKGLLFNMDTGKPTNYGARATALGLAVHAWTFRDDDLPLWSADPVQEMRLALDAGATGIFTDFPGTAVQSLFNN